MLCRPNTIDNIVSFETLRGAQYLPGLIVKIHPPNLVDSTCGDERVSIKGVPVVPILGMVISKITTPMTPDTTLRLAVGTQTVCKVPLRRVQAIMHDDALLEIYNKSNQSIPEATLKIHEIVKKRIDAQWSVEQICTYVRLLDKSKGDIQKTHAMITGGLNGVQAGVPHLREPTRYHSNYSTRKITNFWTPMKAIVEIYYQFSLTLERYDDQGDIDEACAPSHEELGAIQEQIIAVHEVFANFLEALVRVQEASVESKENTNSIAVQEQGPEVAVTEAKVLVADSTPVLRPTRLEDLRSAGFDLSPMPVSPLDGVKTESAKSKHNMKRKRTHI